MAIQKASDYKTEEDNLRIFLTGDFGTGKSVFAASFPTPGFVFNCDHKIVTYRDSSGDWDYGEYDMSPRGWIDFEKDHKEIKLAVTAGKYKTVILDSTTSLMDIAMERAMSLDPKRSETNGPLWNVHYQMVKNLVESKIRPLVTWHCNVVIIAHLKVLTDMKTGDIVGIEPLLTGQLATIIPGYFEEVYCSFTRNKSVAGKTVPDYYLRTVPRGHYKARSCISGKAGLIPAELPNSYEAVMGAYKKAANKKKVA